MKQYLFILTFSLTILVNFNVLGQIKADAGPDLKLCINHTNLDSTYLGGTPTATGSLPPYKYIWSTIPSSTRINLNASDYLNDTSNANPKLNYLGNVTLKLMVIDSKGDFSYDEVKIMVSSNAMNADQKVRYIPQGQSIELYTLYNGGFPPYKYTWTPYYNISDTNAAKPIVKPDTSLTYLVKIVDSMGCIGPIDNFKIYVTPTSLTEFEEEKESFEIIPNPVKDISIVKLSKQNIRHVRISITDLLGNEITVLEPNEFGEQQIRSSDFEMGLYFVQVFEENKFVGRKKIILK